ncbi:hypothetical protein MmiHf6_15690 [Methanimicrococcus hongohii]|uniref:InsA N-terminal domain-containing protein n=1 Tax=Methanimicrococcus hongohii TaxID=3028295 RepID=A0AA96V0T0_9EURY|nr:hypothetical protein [Methanimicrococcus sp. Hf6]WNY24239.1 hypothetical protein MmiHf6_15690 [Methanimicrococcus sp. Hf6]
MEHFIKCPSCREADLELSAIDSKKIHKINYRCNNCDKDFIVEYRNKPKNILDQYWKKALIAALITI